MIKMLSFKISGIFLFLNLILSSFQLEFCQRINILSRMCDKCVSNYSLVNDTCTSGCPDFHYWNSDNKCSINCGLRSLKDKATKTCISISECPTFVIKGSQYHLTATNYLIADLGAKIFYTISADDFEIKLWDYEKGRRVTSFQGHSSNLLKIRFIDLPISWQKFKEANYILDQKTTQNQNKRFLISLSKKGEIFVWDSKKGTIQNQIIIENGVPTTNSEIFLRSFMIFTFGFQGEFFGNNIFTKISYKFDLGHSEKATGVVMIEQMSLVYSFAEDGRILRWQLQDNQYIGFKAKNLCKLDGPIKDLKIIEFSQNRAVLVAIGGKYTQNDLNLGNAVDLFLIIDLINDNSNQQGSCSFNQISKAHQKPISKIKIDDENQIVFSSSDDDQVIKSWFYDNSAGQLNLIGMEGSLYGNIQIYKQEKKVLITNEESYQTRLYLFQPEEIQIGQKAVLEELTTFQHSQNKNIGGFYDETNNQILIYGKEITAYLITANKIHTIDDIKFQISNFPSPLIRHQGPITGIQIDNQNLLTLTHSQDQRIILWDSLKGTYLSEFNHPKTTAFPIKSLILLEYLIVLFNDNSLVIYQYRQQKALNLIDDFPQTIINIRLDPSNARFIVSSDNILRVYSIADGSIVQEITKTDSFHFIELASPFLISAATAGNIYWFTYPEFLQYYSRTDSQVEIYYLAINPNPLLMVFSIAFANKTTTIYSIPGKVIYNHYPPCIDDNPIYIQMGLFPFMFITGTMLGEICVYDPPSKTVIALSNIMNGFPIIGSIQANIYQGISWGNQGGVFGLLVVLDALSSNTQNLIILPPITEVDVDEKALEIKASTLVGTTHVYHYIVSTSIGFKRTQRTIPIKNIVADEDLSIFFVVAKSIELYDMISYALLKSNQEHEGIPIDGILAKQEGIFYSFSTGMTKNLIAWDIQNNIKTSLEVHTDQINGILYNYYLKELISYGRDKQIVVWKDQVKTNSLQVSDDEIKRAVVDQKSGVIVTIDASYGLVIWDSKNSLVQQQTKVPLASGLLLDPANSLIFVYGRLIRVYNFLTGSFITELPEHGSPIIGMLHDISYFLSYDTQEVRCYEQATLKLHQNWAPKKPIFDLQIFKNYVISSSYLIQDIYRWNYIDGIELSSIQIEPLPGQNYDQNPPSQIRGDPDNNFILRLGNFTTSTSKIIYFFNPDMNPPHRASYKLPGNLESGQLVDILSLKRSNMIIVWTKSDFSFYKYYSILSDVGLPRILPYRANFNAIYNDKDQSVHYIDSQKNVWFFQNNLLIFQKTLSYQPLKLAIIDQNLVINGLDSSIKNYDSNIKLLNSFQDSKIEFIHPLSSSQLAVVSRNGTIIILEKNADTNLLVPIQTFNYHSVRVLGFKIDLDFQFFITYDSSGKICILDIVLLTKVIQETQHLTQISKIVFEQQLGIFVSSDQNGKIYVWNYLKTGLKFVKELTFHTNPIQFVDISSQSGLILTTSSNDPLVGVWDVATFSLKSKLIAPGDYRKLVVLNDQYKMLVIANPFQLNIYDSQKLQFINLIRDLQEIKDIQTIQILNDHLVLFTTLNLIRIYSITKTAVILKGNFLMKFAELLKPAELLNIQDSTYSANLLGISETDIFNLTLIITDGAYENCYHQFFDVETYFILREKISLIENSLESLITPIQATVYDIYLKENQEFFFIQDIHTYMLKHEIQLNYRSVQKNGQLKGLTNLQILNDTFMNFELKELLLENFNMTFDGVNTTFILDPQIKIFKLQNVLINSDLNNIDFTMNNLELLSMQNVTILKANINSDQSLFRCQQINQINIDGLFLDGVNSTNLQLFSFYDIQQVNISNFQIKNLEAITKPNSFSFLIQVNNTINLNFKDFDINGIQLNENQNIGDKKNSSRRSAQVIQKNFQNKLVILELYGINDSKLKNVKFSNIENAILIKAASSYSNNRQRIILDSFNTLQIDNMTVYNNSLINLNLLEDSNFNNDNLIYINTVNFKLQNATFQDNYCIEGSIFRIFQTIFYIDSSIFSNNSGKHGGVLLLTETKIQSFKDGVENLPNLINNTIFTQNIAFGSGGAIYCLNSDLDLSNTSFQNNSAEMGGAIRFSQYVPIFYRKMLENKNLNELNESSLNQKIESVFFKNNTASIFGNDVNYYPNSLKIYFQESNKLNQENISLSQVRSGDNFNFYLKFQDQLYPDQQFKLYKNFSDYSNLTQREISSISIEFYKNSNDQLKIEGKSIILINDYNQSINSFVVQNLALSQWPTADLQLNVKNSYTQMYNTDNFNLQSTVPPVIQTQFRQCIRGEILQQTSVSLQRDIIECYQCPLGKYSLSIPVFQQEDPSSFSLICKDCPTSMAAKCEKDVITLKKGYWRRTFEDDLIVECQNNRDLCDNDIAHQYCVQGHIGPLCEECDTNGIIWGNNYGDIGGYTCSLCNQYASTVLLFLFNGLFLLFYILYSMRSLLVIFRKKIMVTYLRLMGFTYMSNSENSDLSSLILQGLLHYFQIVSILNLTNYQLDFQIPYSVTFLPTIIGEPIQSLKNSFDCSIKLFENVPIIYIKCIWSLLVPLLYVVGIGLVYLILIFMGQLIHQQSYIYSGLVFILMLMQPGIVSLLISVISCRKIADRDYIMADLRYECHTSQHNAYIAGLVVPSLIFWGFLIPLILFRTLYQNKNQLNTINIRMGLGYLFQDYKTKFFYWEIVKVVLKLLIVLFHNVLIEYKVVESTIVIVILFIYILISLQHHPILYRKINLIDIFSHVIITVLLHLQILATVSDIYALRLLSIFLILCLNYGYILLLIILFLELKLAYYQKFLVKYMIQKKEQYPLIGRFITRFKIVEKDENRALKNWQKCHHRYATKKMLLQMVYANDEVDEIDSPNRQERKLIEIASSKNVNSNRNIFDNDQISTKRMKLNLRDRLTKLNQGNNEEEEDDEEISHPSIQVEPPFNPIRIYDPDLIIDNKQQRAIDQDNIGNQFPSQSVNSPIASSARLFFQ